MVRSQLIEITYWLFMLKFGYYNQYVDRLNYKLFPPVITIKIYVVQF